MYEKKKFGKIQTNYFIFYDVYFLYFDKSNYYLKNFNLQSFRKEHLIEIINDIRDY